MQSIRSILILLISATIIFGCSSKNNNEDEHGHNHNQLTDAIDDTSDQENDVTEEKESITNNYLKLKDALIESDAMAAREASNQLQSSLEQKEFHNEAELAASLAKEESLEEQRKIFETLALRIYELASEQKFEFNTLYRQYCPMAFDGKGAYWLSNSKEIRNPYFGDKMLKCGRTEETLARK